MSDNAFSGTRVSPLSIDYNLNKHLEQSKNKSGLLEGQEFKLDDATINSFISDFPPTSAALKNYKELKQEFEENKKLQAKNLEKMNSSLDQQLKKYKAEKTKIRAQIEGIKEPPASESDGPIHPPMLISDERAVAKASKLKHEINGEYVYTRLKLVENSKYQLAALMKLKDSYRDILDKTISYLSPYNVHWEQRDAMRALVEEFNKFNGLVEDLQLLEEERSKWIEELKTMTQREHGFMYYLKKITFSNDHSYENDLDKFKREYKMLQKEKKAHDKEEKKAQKSEENMLEAATKNNS